jgi:hypothetical protein
MLINLQYQYPNIFIVQEYVSLLGTDVHPFNQMDFLKKAAWVSKLKIFLPNRLLTHFLTRRVSNIVADP